MHSKTLQSVIDRKLVGAYIRVGRSPKTGPVYRITRYDKSRMLLLTQPAFNTAVEPAPISLEDFDNACAEGILHVIGHAQES